jgi:hypothetical protein
MTFVFIELEQIRIGGGRGTLIPFTPDDTVQDDIWEGIVKSSQYLG